MPLTVTLYQIEVSVGCSLKCGCALSSTLVELFAHFAPWDPHIYMCASFLVYTTSSHNVLNTEHARTQALGESGDGLSCFKQSCSSHIADESQHVHVGLHEALHIVYKPFLSILPSVRERERERETEKGRWTEIEEEPCLRLF